MLNAVLFDLDGTLTDSKEGIINCIKYALKALKIEETDEKKLYAFIGPPLRDMFKKMYCLTDEQADFALLKYRERFSVTGLFENRVYGGIEDALINLQKSGVKICLATGKPIVYAKRILEHFGLIKYFSIMVGSELDGRRTDKTEIVEYALSKLDTKENVIMIGDRKFDVISAHICGIPCIGVKYGFADENELENANADYIADSVDELNAILNKLQKNT